MAADHSNGPLVGALNNSYEDQAYSERTGVQSLQRQDSMLASQGGVHHAAEETFSIKVLDACDLAFGYLRRTQEEEPPNLFRAARYPFLADYKIYSDEAL